MEPILEITGEVERSRDLDFEALQALPGQVPDIGAEIPGRVGGGVRLASLLEVAGVSPGAGYITLATADGRFSASISLDAVRGQGIVVYRLGEGTLPEDQGGPVRFFIVDVEACGLADGGIDQCANVKYLRRIELSSRRGRDTRPGVVEHAEIHPHHGVPPGG